VLGQDRVLGEVHATGGDIRCGCGLVGASIDAPTGYLSTVGHLKLTSEDKQPART